jgi:hypothetical protein
MERGCLVSVGRGATAVGVMITFLIVAPGPTSAQDEIREATSSLLGLVADLANRVKMLEGELAVIKQAQADAKQTQESAEKTRDNMIANLRAQVNAEFKKLTDWGLKPQTTFSWVYRDVNPDWGSPNAPIRYCGSGGFVAGVHSYIEDHSTKEVYACRYLPTLELK